MGTTQRLTPGVKGEPNWGDLNKSITHVAKTIEKEQSIEKEEEKINHKKEEADEIRIIQIERAYKKLRNRKNSHIQNTYRNLIKTGGGRKAIVTGKSSSIGKAGKKSANRIASFFTNVSNGGLEQALSEVGFGTLQGKSFQEVIDFLLIYCSESNEGMDETAANKASCEVMNELAAQSGNDLLKFEDLIKEFVDGQGLADTLCKFWGLYIFEHLSQRFEEKIRQQKGSEVSKETFKIIKDDILGQVKILNDKRPVAKIDWKGKDGKKEIEKIFDSIIKIICDEND